MYLLSWIIPLRFSAMVLDPEGGYSTITWWQWADKIITCKIA